MSGPENSEFQQSDESRQIDLVSGHKNLDYAETKETDEIAPGQTDDCTVQSKEWKIRAAVLGLVVFAEKDYYTGIPEQDKQKPMPVTHDEVIAAILLRFGGRGEVRNILAGHEYGQDNGKSHYQCVVFFHKEMQVTVKPGKFTIGEVTVLYMFQKAKNRWAIQKYCQKEGDFQWLIGGSQEEQVRIIYKKDKDGKDTNHIDPWATIVLNKEKISKKDAMEIALQAEPRTAITMYKNIDYALENIVKEPLPEFSWVAPRTELMDRYPGIRRWWEDTMLKMAQKGPEYDAEKSPIRYKALLLYSEERCMGKTRFAKDLVNHKAYFVCFRNTFLQSALIGKQPELLLLDDMRFAEEQNLETWKALTTGEPTAIRDAYTNFWWSYNVPCIITSNNLNFCSWLATKPEFKTTVIFQTINEYMGPEGTRPQMAETTELYVNDAFLAAMQKHMDKKDSKEDKEKTLLAKIAELEQTIKDQSDTIRKQEKKMIHMETEYLKKDLIFAKRGRDLLQAQAEIKNLTHKRSQRDFELSTERECKKQKEDVL